MLNPRKLLFNKTILKDTIQWDVRNWGQALVYWQPIIDSIKDKKNKKVLCLGERDGGLALWFALQGFQVTCTDIFGITDTAKELHQAYKVSDRIVYNEVDIFHIHYPSEHFDIVVCKSVIGGLKTTYSDSKTRTLDNQKLATTEINRILKKGAYFFGAENLKGSVFHQYYRKKVKGNKIGWRHLSRTEVEWLFSDYSLFKHRSFGFVGTFYRQDILNTFFFRVDQLASFVLPSNWCYIDLLIAQK